MKLELKGSNIDNASNNNIGKATLVRVHCTSKVFATLTIKEGIRMNATVGTVYIPVKGY